MLHRRDLAIVSLALTQVLLVADPSAQADESCPVSTQITLPTYLTTSTSPGCVFGAPNGASDGYPVSLPPASEAADVSDQCAAYCGTVAGCGPLQEVSTGNQWC